VREHDAGYVIQPGAIPDLVDALRTLAADASQRQRLGANGRQAAEQYFNRETIVTCFIQHLETNL
jgi:glycosyltransferase involved in cell wall biosynthesis